MRNFKDIILEKLKVTKNTAFKPELLDHNLVSCTMEFFFKWLMVLDQDKPLTQADFEDFEVFEDDYLRDEFNTYENLFNWYEDNKSEFINVKVTPLTEEYKNVFFHDGIRFLFLSGDNLIDTTK